MIDKAPIDHHIQKYIMGILMHRKYVRFRDMRPPKTDTNLYSYHLKLLQKNGFIEKTTEGYTLSRLGMFYVDRINAQTVKLSPQPKVITMFVIQNEEGQVLIYQKLRQPFIDTWTLPFGKVHNDDSSIAEAAQREIHEKIGQVQLAVHHVGDCYIRIKNEGNVSISTLAHIFYGKTSEPITSQHLRWIKPHKIAELELAPAVEQIVARTFFRDPYFFEEFTVDW